MPSPPLSIYLHIPWCVRKCPYCDFNSHAIPTEHQHYKEFHLENNYIAAISADINRALTDYPLLASRPIQSIFFGGGTPSLFSSTAIAQLIQLCREHFNLTSDCEISLEANPGTFEKEKFLAFRSAGINRLSLGVQSFHDPHLLALGRIHSGKDARIAAEIALSLFDKVNIDLMFGLPNQTIDEALSDINIALSLNPHHPLYHLSAYQLTIEANTLFSAKPPRLPDEDMLYDMGDKVAKRLMQAGFIHYEISAYAKAGHECRHNQNYWRFGDYLGLGAGAHSKITVDKTITREERIPHPTVYMEKAQSGNPIRVRHTVSEKERPLEFMMNALRLTEGLRVEDYQYRTWLSIVDLLNPLIDAESKGLIEGMIDGKVVKIHPANLSNPSMHIRPTTLGTRHLNHLLSIFL